MVPIRDISRDIVTCESIDGAQDLAEAEMTAFLGISEVTPVNDMEITVDYAPGSDQDWEKGNFINVSAVVFVNSWDPFSSGYKYASEMVMIEYSGNN